MWPRFDSDLVSHVDRVCHCFLSCSESFPNSNLTRIEDLHKNQLKLVWLPLLILCLIFIFICLLALPFGVTTETLATQDPDREDEETDTPIFEKYDAMLHGQRKDHK